MSLKNLFWKDMSPLLFKVDTATWAILYYTNSMALFQNWECFETLCFLKYKQCPSDRSCTPVIKTIVRLTHFYHCTVQYMVTFNEEHLVNSMDTRAQKRLSSWSLANVEDPLAELVLHSDDDLLGMLSDDLVKPGTESGRLSPKICP